MFAESIMTAQHIMSLEKAEKRESCGFKIVSREKGPIDD